MSRELILILAFAAATLLGYKLINSVPSLLHTPLMSGMNALSGVTVLGCMTAMGLGLAACAPTPPTATKPVAETGIYGARTDSGPNGEPIEINAVRPAYLTESNRRQRVAYNGPEAPGTIVVDPYARFLYHVLDNGEAMRFGIAVGQAGKNFRGNAAIRRKQAWPSWTPTRRG